MKSFWRVVLFVLPAAVGGLFAGCVLGGLALGFYSLLAEGGTYSNFAAGWAFGLFVAMFAVMYGVLPVVLYGAPIYALLFRWRRTNYLTVSVAGLIPGLVLLLAQPSLAGAFLGFGIIVAWCTHFLAKRSPSLHRMNHEFNHQLQDSGSAV